MPSKSYELSLDTSFAKVGRDGCKVFMCKCKMSKFILYLYSFFINNQGEQHKM